MTHSIPNPYPFLSQFSLAKNGVVKPQSMNKSPLNNVQKVSDVTEKNIQR